ncbi:MAG: hypothetical protein IPM24_26195 [Bryobacterales bacterium]|jgi:hypothetical protein|nr:hypothetical protein [Bryobacterales bacterium]
MECPLEMGGRPEILLEPGAERHAAECARCRDWLRNLETTRQALDLWQPEPVRPGFDRALWQRIEAEEARRWWRPWRPLAPALAAAAVLVGAVILSSGPEPRPLAEFAEIEQIEQTLSDVQMLRDLGLTQPL